MWISNQPYTTFRATNAKDGKARLQDGAYGQVIKTQTLSADRQITIGDASGSAVVKGTSANFNWGTLSVGSFKLGSQDTLSTIVTATGVAQGFGYIAQSQDDSIIIARAYGSGVNSLGIVFYNGTAATTVPAQTIAWTQLT